MVRIRIDFDEEMDSLFLILFQISVFTFLKEKENLLSGDK